MNNGAQGEWPPAQISKDLTKAKRLIGHKHHPDKVESRESHHEHIREYHENQFTSQMSEVAKIEKRLKRVTQGTPQAERAAAKAKEVLARLHAKNEKTPEPGEQSQENNLQSQLVDASAPAVGSENKPNRLPDQNLSVLGDSLMDMEDDEELRFLTNSQTGGRTRTEADKDSMLDEAISSSVGPDPEAMPEMDPISRESSPTVEEREAYENAHSPDKYAGMLHWREGEQEVLPEEGAEIALETREGGGSEHGSEPAPAPQVETGHGTHTGKYADTHATHNHKHAHGTHHAGPVSKFFRGWILVPLGAILDSILKFLNPKNWPEFDMPEWMNFKFGGGGGHKKAKGHAAGGGDHGHH